MADSAIRPDSVRANPEPLAGDAKLDSATAWYDAVRDYGAKKAFSDALSMEDETAGDAAINAYCEAMDHLVLNVRAPDHAALAYKMILARDRFESSVFPHEWLVGFLADVRALAVGGR